MSDTSPTRHICPNCRAHIDALAVECRSCGADFGETAAWRPIAAASQASEIEPPRLQARPTPGKGLLIRLEEALGLSALTVVGVLLLAAVIDDYLTFGAERFNAATWLKKPTRAEEDQCYRGVMAYDVKNNVLRKGMSRAEVEARLGPPDLVSGGYDLGLCSTWDKYSLELRYDVKDRLLSSSVVQH